MSLIKSQLNNNLQVEQLQEDIICIMESHFPNENVDEVIELLCNAVVLNLGNNEWGYSYLD